MVIINNVSEKIIIIIIIIVINIILLFLVLFFFWVRKMGASVFMLCIKYCGFMLGCNHTPIAIPV